MFRHAALVHHAGMRIKHLAHGRARSDLIQTGLHRISTRFVHILLQAGRFTHNQRAHQAGMIAAIDSGKFQGQLISRIKRPASAVVTAQQSILTRTDDELVARVISPAAEDRALHGSQNIAFIRTGTGHVYGSIQCLVRQLGSPFNIAEFARALDHAHSRGQFRNIRQ